VFWHVQALRYFYLASTIFFATVVLLGHYHYSIDVFAALFISYGTYQIALWLFPRDYALFRSADEGAENHALSPQAQVTR
jgi:hypothetical protein